MFDVAPTELIVLGTVALMVIPPKDLPRAMRTAGYWVGRARGVARQFRSGFDTIIRDAELAEMEQRWKAENERIMREHPAATPPTTSPTTSGTPGADADPGDMDAPPAMVDQPAIVDAPAHAPVPSHADEPLSVEAPVVAPAAPDTPPAADTKAPS
ncbi:Sec-independent protein translocase subunit TatA/TatB [Sphingomonas bacterium]|uniref:Sec-independent protein translocase subunit TatA/TatB n=1 Tax=Sphingomonas bacterium TaxID=1895847 RepID=UPI0015775446|nr:twin-arginine translocase subunit TatB [Sphingomonas bacterium]